MQLDDAAAHTLTQIKYTTTNTISQQQEEKKNHACRR